MRRKRICGFTLVELLVVISIISVLAMFLVPAVFNVRKRVYRSQCMNNLRSLGQMALLYAEDNKQWFPVGKSEEPKAYESLQLIVDSIKDARKPDLYVCPVALDQPVQGWNEEGDEPFTLTEDNVSYAWRNKKLRSTSGSGTNTALGCDNSIAMPEIGTEENHDDGLNLLYVDAAVKYLTLSSDLKEMRGFENKDMNEFVAAKGLGM